MWGIVMATIKHFLLRRNYINNVKENDYKEEKISKAQSNEQTFAVLKSRMLYVLRWAIIKK